MLQPNGLFWIGLLSGGCALLYALLLSRRLKKPLGGSSGLHRAKSLLKKSGLSFLKWHGVTLFALLFLGGGALFALSTCGYLPNPYLPFAFLTGALCALLPQLLDLRYLPRWAAQSAAALEASPQRGLVLLLSAGRIRAFASLGLTLTELSGWFFFLSTREDYTPGYLTGTMLTFGVGGAVVALFTRHLGLFSAAARLGSLPLEDGDKSIPPEDLRNPSSAVQALGAFLHDPTAGLMAAWRCLLPAAFALGMLAYDPEGLGVQAVFYPMLMTAVGVLASLISSLRGIPEGHPFRDGSFCRRLRSNLWLTLLLTAAVSMPFSFLLFGSFRPCLSFVAGLLCAPAVTWGTQFSVRAAPRRAVPGKVSVATWLIMGLYGLLPLLLLLCALLGAFRLSGSEESSVAGLYGIALAGVGLLSPIGDLLPLSSCGALAQGAISLTFMSGDMAEPDWAFSLGLLGKRFSSVGRGYSLSASLTASLLLLLAWTGARAVPLSFSPSLVGGVLFGVILVLGVPALLLLGSKKTAVALREEIQRQYKEIKGLRSGKTAPHALSCVDQTAISSLFWTVIGIFGVLALSALTGGAMGTAGALGLFAAVVILAFLPGFFLITAGEHWSGTPLEGAVYPLKWAAGPVLGELALMTLTVLLTLM